MAVNHVVINGETILDMRGATATAADITDGVTAYGASGELLVGTAKPGGGTLTINAPAGCTATITKGTDTKSATVGSSGEVTFTGLESGEWEVTIDSGNNTASRTVTITTDYSVTMEFFSATISVTYPEGSTCTCSDGSTTLTAPDTSGSCTFTVPNAGTWTVTCTDGTNTKTQSVSITTSGQTENVTLTYGTYLYNNGAVSGYTWTCKDDLDYQQAEVTDKGTYLELYGGGNSYTMFYSKNKINVSAYKTLKMTLTNASMKLDSEGMTFGLTSSTTVSSGSPLTTKTKYSAFSGTKELSVDISSVTRSMYVALFVSTPPGGEFSARVTQIWFE